MMIMEETFSNEYYIMPSLTINHSLINLLKTNRNFVFCFLKCQETISIQQKTTYNYSNLIILLNYIYIFKKQKIVIKTISLLKMQDLS